MITPNSLQVKAYFFDALKVKSLSSERVFFMNEVLKLKFYLGTYWYVLQDGSEEVVWDDYYGYAKIIENK